MTTTRPATKSLQRRREELAGCERSIAGYKAMLAAAQAHNMEYEIDCMSRTLAEFEGELDHLIEQAAEAGYGPEDFE